MDEGVLSQVAYLFPRSLKISRDDLTVGEVTAISQERLSVISLSVQQTSPQQLKYCSRAEGKLFLLLSLKNLNQPQR